MRLGLLSACVMAGLAASAAANAAVTVIGGGLAEDCSKAALRGRSDRDSVELCNLALTTEMLDAKDKAGTYINRGVMRMRQRAYDSAHSDFDAAIKLDPKIGEGWVNRGAVWIAAKRYQEGLADINRGLDLGVVEPEKAYYNRALAYEGLDDAKSAYLDYQQAVSLKPNWLLPQQQLLRFTVTHR